MPAKSQTWIVMLRDVSASVTVRGEPVVMAGMVMEAETGLVLGVRVASDATEALTQALETALTDPPGTLVAGSPERVVCNRGLSTQVERALATLTGDDPLPPISESDPVLGAEDVFDSFLGHLAGRRQPEEFPEPGDWSLVVGATRRYREQAPWERWSDTVPLLLDLETPAGHGRYLCVVLGAEGIQRGLAIYPGDELPAGIGRWGPGGPERPPAGTQMLLLDPPSELPAELGAKALRYGWPATDKVVPAFISMGAEGLCEPGPRDLHIVATAVTAVVAHDRRGPIMVGAASATTGELELPGGRRATFSIAVPTGRTAAGRGAGPNGDETASDHLDGSASIDALFGAFLADQGERLAARTLRKYETVIELLADCLNGYGHLSLTTEERQRWEAAYEQDEEAFVHLFGADKIVDNLGEFLGYFMIRKVAAGEDLLRAAGTVTKKLAAWLAQHGYLSADDAEVAAELGADAARELPRAERLSRLLYEHTRRSPVDVDALHDGDYLEDHLFIDRVEPGELWLEGGIGPVSVPVAVSAIARPGWSLSISLARLGDRWHVVDVGSVYP